MDRKQLDKWWWPTGEYSESRPSVWYFVPAGVDPAYIVAHLIPKIGPHNFGVWRMPGRGVREADPHPENLRAVAREVAESIAAIGARRPVLAGNSFGGLLAFVAAQELEKLGVPVGRFIPIVTACPNEWRAGAVWVRLRGGTGKFTQRLMAKVEANGLPVPNDDELEKWGKGIEVDFAMGFGAWRHSKLNASITDITATDDSALRISSRNRWRRYTRGEFDSVAVTGDHTFYRDHPEVVTRVLEREADLAHSDLS